jgi:hypothetical protein
VEEKSYPFVPVVLSIVCFWVNGSEILQATRIVEILLQLAAAAAAAAAQEDQVRCKHVIVDSWLCRCLAACFFKHHSKKDPTRQPRTDKFSKELRCKVLQFTTRRAQQRSLQLDFEAIRVFTWALRCIDTVSFTKSPDFRKQRSIIVRPALEAIIIATIPRSFELQDRLAAAVKALRAVNDRVDDISQICAELGALPVLSAAGLVLHIFPNVYHVPKIESQLKLIMNWLRPINVFRNWRAEEPMWLVQSSKEILEALQARPWIYHQWLGKSLTNVPAKALDVVFELLQPFYATVSFAKELVNHVLTASDSPPAAVESIWNSGPPPPVPITRTEICYALCRIGMDPTRALSAIQIGESQLDIEFEEGVIEYLLPYLQRCIDETEVAEPALGPRLSEYLCPTMLRIIRDHCLPDKDQKSFLEKRVDLAQQLVEDNPFEPCTRYETPQDQLPDNVRTTDDCRVVFNLNEHPDGRIVGTRNDVDKLQAIIEDATQRHNIAYDSILYRATTAITAALLLSYQICEKVQDFGSAPAVYFTTKLDQALCHNPSTTQAIIVLFVTRPNAQTITDCLHFPIENEAPCREWHEVVLSSRTDRCDRTPSMTASLRPLNLAPVTYGALWKKYRHRPGGLRLPLEWHRSDGRDGREVEWTDDHPRRSPSTCESLADLLQFSVEQREVYDQFAFRKKVPSQLEDWTSLILYILPLPNAE